MTNLVTCIVGNVRRSDELLREERNSRNQLENALRSNNDIIQQLTNRIARAEEKSQEERNAISSLVNHTKSVEQAVLGSQQELKNKQSCESLLVLEASNADYANNFTRSQFTKEIKPESFPNKN